MPQPSSSLHLRVMFGALAFAILARPAPVAADAEDDFELARNLFRDAGDYATAAQLFADFIRNHPGDGHLPAARLMLARSYARSGRCADAVSAYEGFYEGHPEDLAAAEARRERAGCLRDLGQFGRAAIAFEEVQRLYSESQFAALSLLEAAGSYARGGDADNAQRAYAKLLTDYPTSTAARRGHFRLAQLRFASGDPDGAQDLLANLSQAAPRSQETRDALLLSGRIHLFLGRTVAGEAVFSQLQESFPNSAHSDSARLDLGEHHLDHGRYEEAEAAYTRAVDADSGPAARAHLGRADALRLAGRHEAALEEYEPLATGAAVALVREQARLGSAIALGQTGRFGAAVGMFLELVQTPSGTPPSVVSAAAMRELGALYRRQGDLARSGSWFRRYLEDVARLGVEFPESARERDLTRLQLAQVYASGGYHDDAVRLFADLSRGSGSLAAEAQYGLASAYEGSGARRLAVGEYRAFLDRHPGHPRAAQVRQRVEYLSWFTVSDADGLARALQQAYVDQLSGVSSRRVLLDVARSLRDHQDFANAVRAFETYVASYGGDPTAAEAQFYLADCLYRLARQRQLEGRTAAGDSLHALALQEDRILADGDAGPWPRLAQLRRVEAAAAAAADSARQGLLEAGYSEFLERHPRTADNGDARARALLGLADARRSAAGGDSSRLAQADSAYAQLLDEAGRSPLAPGARFGRAVVSLERDHLEAAIDSLGVLLVQVPGAGLQPRVLAVLGRALAQAGRHVEAAARLGELLLAYPDFEDRRQAEERLADTYLQLGEARRAGELFYRLAGSDPAGDVDGSLRRRLVHAHHLSADYGAALAVYDQLLAEGAGPADSLHLARGRLLARLERTDEAIAAFGRVRTPALGSAAALGAADLHFAAGRFEPAWSAYQPLLDGEAMAAPVMGRAVVCLFELGRLEEAGTWVSRHRKRFGKEGVWPHLFRLHEGRHWLARGEWDRARKIFEGVVEDAAGEPTVAGDEAEAPGLLGRLASDPAGAGAFLAATADWERMRSEPSEEGTARALQTQSNFALKYPDSPFAADVYLRLATFHEALDNLLPAAGAYRRVVEGPHGTQPQRQEAIWKLLQCYTRLFQWDEALRVARTIQSDYPEHPHSSDVQLEIGYILKETGQYAEAIDFLSSVLEWAEGEDAAEARYYIGEAYQNTGDYRKAIQAYYQVAFHGKDASTNWINSADFRRAGCHEQLGEIETARSIYQRIIRREGADSEYGRAARRRIDELRAPAP